MARSNSANDSIICIIIRPGVDGLCQAAEPGLRFLNPFQVRQDVPQETRQAVQFPDDQNISFTKMVE